ncbi:MULTISPECIES: sulfotransferase [unclassified Oleiphilus]|uniref:sulfotransferase family protein n=1 Tax=unclassified Oleiphilus TaxID=2631174 RepID=UPI000A5A8499|nr:MULTISPECIES: sulfotransferase [unclassified Oleiphilus]
MRTFERAEILVLNYPFYWFRSNKKKQRSCLIFIVGAPRTGSTILYQALTNCYDVKYIDNLAASWFKQLPFGMWLSHRRFGLEPHNNFVAEHGNTAEFGEHAPSECGQFWYRWLSKEDHFVDAGAVSQESIDQIRKELSAVSGMFGLPLLFKNLNMGQRLRLIKEFAPDAKIIFIRRDPRFTVRSILRAREKMGVASNEMWSVRPKNFRELQALTEGEMCAAQVYHLEKQIKEDLSLFPDENVMTVQYNKLSVGAVKKMGEWLGLEEKGNSDFPEFKKDSKDSIPQHELSMLDAAIEKYDFDKDIFC